MDESIIKSRIRAFEPVIWETSFLDKEQERDLFRLVKKFLLTIESEELFSQISYCLYESIVNSQKAMAKRIYFVEKRLNINDEYEYRNGMINFTNSVLSRINSYEKKFLEYSYTSRVSIQLREDGQFLVAISNNGDLHPEEEKRLKSRIALGNSDEDLPDIYDKVMDETEGAGLGIVMIVLILKKLAPSSFHYNINQKDGRTITSFSILISEVSNYNTDIINGRIIESIKNIAGFPDKVLKLQTMLIEPDAEIPKIAKIIEEDPALTADLLHMVNLNDPNLMEEITSVQQAVVRIGLDGLNMLVLANSALNNLTARKSKLWEHSLKTAIYAYSILRIKAYPIDICSSAYLCGLLHDIGDILLLEEEPKLRRLFAQLSKQKHIELKTLNFILSGYSHTSIGYKLGLKWNFPELLLDAIQRHHQPAKVRESNKLIVVAVHLADLLSYIDDISQPTNYIDDLVFDTLKIESYDELESLHEQLLDIAKDL